MFKKQTRMEKYKALRDEIELENLLDQRVFLTGDSNKYKEALDFISNHSDSNGYDCKDEDEFGNNLRILRELVNNYSKYEKALDKACRELSDNEECTTLDNYCHSEEEWKEWLLK